MIGTILAWLRRNFHQLQAGTYAITSDSSDDYNCIAWAADDTENWWWPIDCPDVYWPEGLPYEVSRSNFITAFRQLGYRSCADGSVEKGFEKVVIYVTADDKPTHMAKQLGGVWSSKLGDGYDIAHEYLSGIDCRAYGQARYFLRRKTKSARRGCLSFGLFYRLR